MSWHHVQIIQHQHHGSSFRTTLEPEHAYLSAYKLEAAEAGISSHCCPITYTASRPRAPERPFENTLNIKTWYELMQLLDNFHCVANTTLADASYSGDASSSSRQAQTPQAWPSVGCRKIRLCAKAFLQYFHYLPTRG